MRIFVFFFSFSLKIYFLRVKTFFKLYGFDGKLWKLLMENSISTSVSSTRGGVFLTRGGPTVKWSENDNTAGILLLRRGYIITASVKTKMQHRGEKISTFLNPIMRTQYARILVYWIYLTYFYRWNINIIGILQHYNNSFIKMFSTCALMRKMLKHT